MRFLGAWRATLCFESKLRANIPLTISPQKNQKKLKNNINKFKKCDILM